MARLIFWSGLPIAAVIFFAAPQGVRACGGGSGGSTSSGSAASMVSAARSSSAAAAMSAARAMMMSRSAMVRPYGGINYGMNPGYMGSGFGNSGADSSSSSPRMASRARSAIQSKSSSAAAVKPAQAVDPAGEASNLDLPTRDWIVSGETGDTVITAQYAGMIDSNVTLRRTDGHITLAPVDRLNASDREYVVEQLARKTASTVAKD
jgi:hypothetical protein